MTKPAQPSLFPPRKPSPAPAPTRDAYVPQPFDFAPGPECEPRPEWIVPDVLKLWIDGEEFQ